MKKIFSSLLVTILYTTTYMTVFSLCNASDCITNSTCGISNESSCTRSSDEFYLDEYEDTCCDNQYSCKTHFSPRSQGLDGGRRLAGHFGRHIVDEDELYYNLDITLSFQRSFNSANVGKFISPTCSNRFEIGPDCEPTTDIRNHDLGYDSTGKITLKPRLSSFIADMNLFVGMNEWLYGLFLEAQAPIVHTWWEPNCAVDDNPYDVDAMFPEYLMAQEETKVGTAYARAATQGQYTWGEAINNQYFGLICYNKKTKTRLADLRIRLGYNLLFHPDIDMGIKIIFAAPTGNKPMGRLLWEPIVGNGGHYELGMGFYSGAVLFDKDEKKTVSYYGDTEVTHMFATSAQYRSFDLNKNGCFSRYLLLKKYSRANDTIILYPENGLERGINVFTQETKVRIKYQIDSTSMLRINYHDWSLDIGYNFWARDREKIVDICCNIPEQTYGIKGNLPLYADDGGTIIQDLRTASQATITCAQKNGIDITDQGATPTDDDIPVFIKDNCTDLDLCSASNPWACSHSVFAHASYHCPDSKWNPTIGIGGKVEFSGHGNAAADQWAMWLKCNISF